MSQTYKALRSTIHVCQVKGEDRVYEATTDDNTEFWGVTAKQLSGPPLELNVWEFRFKIWGGGRPPEHPTRQHVVQYKVDGKLEQMNEIRGGDGAIEFFHEFGAPGELGFYISETSIVGA